MDSEDLSTYQILVKGSPSTDEIDQALRNEPWWTERSAQGKRSNRHRQSTSSTAIRKRRISSGFQPLSAPLSFRTNVPMPHHDDTTDESDSDASHTLSVFGEDEEATTGLRYRANPTISFAPLPRPQQSFNDLPSKAQHLIINEMIRSQSKDTGVVFTTLPPPSIGTYKSAKQSEDWLESLAILCDKFPPAVLIHSKSLTVTTAL